MSVTSAIQKAQTVLRENYVLEPPIDAYELARNYGIEVREQSFPEDFNNVSGFINIENGAPVMYVNADEPDHRKKFTVAHELGHWLLHEQTIRKDPEKAILFRTALGVANKDPMEKEANAFAAELLVPMNMFNGKSKKSVQELAEIFQVSNDVIGYRKVSAEHAKAATTPAKKTAK